MDDRLEFEELYQAYNLCLKNKKKLIKELANIVENLKETNQKTNMKKTKIDTAYHGVQFLGKISYPYGYQKPGKQLIIRVCQKGKNIKYDDKMDMMIKWSCYQKQTHKLEH